MSELRHKKVAAGPDVPGYEVVFSDWNADHATDEMDTSKVLHPDGAGGVAFGPQSGSPLTVTDGTTSVPNVTKLTADGATVAAPDRPMEPPVPRRKPFPPEPK